MALYNWESVPRQTLVMLLKQVVCTAIDAFLKFGFIHGDLHCNNILIKKTKIHTIDYGFYTVDTNGYKAFIMDFELSENNKTVNEFYKHMYYVFWTSVTRYLGDYLGIEYTLHVSKGIAKLYETAKEQQDALALLKLL